LIGCGSYRHLEDLPAVRNNVVDLAGTLTDPVFGGFLESGCSVLPEDVAAVDVFDALCQAGRDAEDTFLVYFAGHGVLGGRNELHLALSNTRDDSAAALTGLPYDQVREALLESPALNRVVILDCCFAGRAIQDMAGGEGSVAGQIGIEGTYTLAAAPRDRIALAPEGAVYTAFTGALLELLQKGVPGGSELLTLAELYPRLRSMLAGRRQPEPRQQGTDTVTGLALTRNPAHRAVIDLAGPTPGTSVPRLAVDSDAVGPPLLAEGAGAGTGPDRGTGVGLTSGDDGLGSVPGNVTDGLPWELTEETEEQEAHHDESRSVLASDAAEVRAFGAQIYLRLREAGMPIEEFPLAGRGQACGIWVGTRNVLLPGPNLGQLRAVEQGVFVTHDGRLFTASKSQAKWGRQRYACEWFDPTSEEGFDGSDSAQDFLIRCRDELLSDDPEPGPTTVSVRDMGETPEPRRSRPTATALPFGEGGGTE
jgi:hypothetical protein